MRTNILFGCILFWNTLPAFGLERATAEQIESYRVDGTLQDRIEAAKTIGNQDFSPEIVARLKYKMQILPLLQQGLSPEQIAVTAPPPAWKGLPTTGTAKVLTLLIDFSDYQHNVSSTVINSMLYGDGEPGNFPQESLRNYYRRASYNKLEIQGDTLGWYNTGQPRSAVPQTSAGREDLIKQALNYYDSQGHDFSQYDNDGDGYIDYLVVMWTGPNGAWASFWWGYLTGFGDSSYTIDGKKLSKYSWQWESGSPVVVIHESGHALGVPDYYDYDNSVGPRGGLGGLDVMDANRGDHNCFSKFMLDWLTPVNYDAGTHSLTLRASDAYGDSVKVMPGGSAGNPFEEFFMVQNRRQAGNDTGYPNNGLLIWHVDARLDGAGISFLFNNSYTAHKLLRLMEADGLEEIEQNGSANAGDYYVPGKNFSPGTAPNSNRYDGSGTGVFVSNIGSDTDARTLDSGISSQYLQPSFPQVNIASLTAAWTNIPGARYDAVLSSSYDYADIVSSATQDSNSLAFTGLSSGSKYYFQVKLSTDTDDAFLANRVSTHTLPGSWAGAGPMSAARAYHTSTLLPGGKVLVAGGLNYSYLSSAELYDQNTNTWSGAGPMSVARYSHTATVLPNGKVLVTGNALGSSIAELYDPETNSWSGAGALTSWNSHTATLLPNGKVLVAGGAVSGSGITAAELYDPETNSWSGAAPMATPRTNAAAVLLPNGKVLVTGGSYLNSTELYDPGTDTWANAAPMVLPRHYHTATLLANGKVLVAGGGGYAAELYDPDAGTWANAGSLSAARYGHTATLLANGKVLVTGGPDASTDIYDPGTNAWISAGAMSSERVNHAATLLPNGKTLVTGGRYGAELSSADLFSYPAALTRLNPAFTQVGVSSVAVSWAAVAGASYSVALSADANFMQPLSVTTQGGNTKTFTGLSEGVRYYFEVKLSTEVEWAYAGNRIDAATLPGTALSWTGEAGYGSDGLAPEIGSSTDTFVYRVKYTSVNDIPPAGGYPKVHVKKGGSEVQGSPFAMAYVSGGNNTGAIYAYSIILGTGTDYTYYFEARDAGNDTAKGPPVSELGAPDVSLADLFEPDNDAASARTILPGLTQVRSIIPAADTDWVKFTLPGASDIALETSGMAGSDTVLRVYDAGLVQIGLNDDFGTTFSRVSLTGLPAGTYYAKVDEYRNDAQIPWYYLDLTVETGTALHPGFSQLYVASATVTWDAIDGADYTLALSSDSAFVNIFSTTTGTENTKTFTGLAAGTSWYFEVKLSSESDTAYAANRISSATLAIVPGPPAGPVFTKVYNSSMTVNWSSGTAESGFNPDGMLYNVEISTAPGFEPVFKSSQTYKLSAGLVGLSANTSYYARAQAISQAGSPTPFTVLGSTVTRAYAPGALAVLAVSSSSISLDWAPNGNPEPGTDYEVWQDTQPGFVTPVKITVSTSALLADSLLPKTAYCFKARSVDLALLVSTFNVAICTSTYPSPPGAVTLTGTALGVSSVSWSWNDAGDEAGYDITAATGGIIAGGLAANTTRWIETGLPANTAYSRRTSAFNISGVAVSTPATCYTLAAPPTGFAVREVNSNSVTLQWGGGTNPAGTRYEVSYWTAGDSTATVTVAATSAALTGLAAGEFVYSTVRALNGDNIPSAYAATLSAFVPDTGQVISAGAAALVTFQAPSGEVSLNIPENTFRETVKITVGVPALQDCYAHAGNLKPMAAPVCVRIELDKPLQPGKNVELSLSYRDSDLGGMDRNKLVIARYDDAHSAWVPLFSDRAALNKVRGRADHFSLFQIMEAAPARGLAAVTIGPNILRPGRDPGQLMTFRNLPAGARVRIYTLAGELVHDTTEDGTGNAVWNGRNRAGAQAASGIYVALVEAGGKKKTFRVAVER